MVTIETIATVTEDGTITARAPGAVPRGRHRAVIVLEDVPLEKESLKRESRRGFPDMASFRESLGVSSYPGNTILEMREEERD
ncbi:MAG TPA: hypothetical protein VKM72_30960 [Thermoanaerobaculia bacterium]|nr:hypothetical protein [Thermoanaerobaculia bacterium]